MAGRHARTTRGRFVRPVVAVLALLCLAAPALMPASSAAFTALTTGPASSFTARATFGLTQTAPCFSDIGGGCTTVPGIAKGVSVVVSPDGKHVYTGSATNSVVAEFSRNATTGALTRLASPNACVTSTAGLAGCTTIGSTIMDEVWDLAISPDGKHVYVAAYSSSTVVSFSRNSTTGALTLLRCLYDGSVSAPAGCASTSARGIKGANGIVVSPDGAYVYVTGYGSNALAVFTRNATTGALTQASGISGCFANGNNNSIGCTTDVRGMLKPYYLRVSPDGASVYVAGYSSNAIAIFQRDMATGVLAQPASPNKCFYNTTSTVVTECTAARGLSNVYHVGIAPDGATVYALGNTSNAVAAFTRNASTGVLTPVAAPNACVNSGTVLTGCSAARAISGPTGIDFSPDGLFAFVSAQGSNAVAVFRHNNNTGVLTQLTGTSGCVGGLAGDGCTAGLGLSSAGAVATSPDGRDVYVAGGSTDGYVTVLNLTH
ncbi:beta-propeller fold lactonase family protein [Actinoplanes sp. NPDC051346]|uniref:lactonase family protein n=1 Tax=Actinoplanes sp. NPDC051346 TaxID=3155048 RepID=UPI00341320CF